MHLWVLYGSQNKQRFFSVYVINLPVFINEAEGVYCAVRTVYLKQTYTFSSLHGQTRCNGLNTVMSAVLCKLLLSDVTMWRGVRAHVYTLLNDREEPLYFVIVLL
jgi:hypothetical protein